MGSNITYTSNSTVISISSFIPSNLVCFLSIHWKRSDSGGITIPTGWSITLSVYAGLHLISNVTIDNTSGSGTLAVPISALNFYSSGVNVGSTHTSSLFITINTSSSGSILITNSTMNVMQI